MACCVNCFWHPSDIWHYSKMKVSTTQLWFPEFPIGSNVLITYPANFRLNQLRGPFTMVSVEKSMYMLRSCVDPAKLLALLASRLVPYKDNLVYSSPASQVAASDFSEFVEWRWGYLAVISALDTCIITNLTSFPSLFRLLPKHERSLIRVNVVGALHFYIFLYRRSRTTDSGGDSAQFARRKDSKAQSVPTSACSYDSILTLMVLCTPHPSSTSLTLILFTLFYFLLN